MQLRLFKEFDVGDPRKWTLSEVWKSHHREKMLEAERSTETIKEYSISLNLWEKATERIPVEAINDDTGAQFTGFLKRRRWRGKPIESNTRLKHLRHVQAVLDRLLPKTRKNPWGLGLLADVPLLAKPDVVIRDADASTCSRGELRKVMAACQQVYPGERGQMWRDFHELCFYSLMRVEAMWDVQSRWLVDDKISRKYGGRWISVPAEFSKVGLPYRCFMATASMPLLERLDAKMGRWFAPICREERWFNECRQKIWEAAGVKRYDKPIHAIRKLGGGELGDRNPLAQKMQLGHAVKDVALNHYTSRRVQAKHVSLRKPLFKPEGGSK